MKTPDEHTSWCKNYDVMMFNVLEINEVVRGLHRFQEPSGDISREPELEQFDQSYLFDEVLRKIVKRSVVPLLRHRLGTSKPDRKVWEEAVEEAFASEEVRGQLSRWTSRKQHKEDRERFLMALEDAGAPLRERLAVKRGNRLHDLDYRYGLRGKLCMSRRLGKKGREAMRRAAKRVLSIRRSNG